MLNRLNQGLLAAMVVQLVLVALVYGQSLWASDGPTSTPLLAFDTDQLARITLQDHSGETDRTLTLKHKDDRWWLTHDGERYPANPATVDSVLTPLGDAKLTWPVADSGGAAERFKTAPDNVQRQVTLESTQGETQHLYFGTAPAYRQVHVRRDDDQAVYAVNVNAVDLNAKPDAWLDPALLQVDLEPVTEVRLADHRLTRAKGDDGWTLADSPDLTLDQGAWRDWLKRWTTLNVSGWASDDAAGAIDDTDPTLSVEFQADQPITLALYHTDDSDLITRSDEPGVFRLPAGTAKALANLDGLWRAPSSSADAASDDTVTAPAD